MGEDEQIFLAAAILLSSAIGRRREPADEKQLVTAIWNAHNLHDEVKKRHEKIAAGQLLGWIEYLKKQGSTNS